MNIYFCITENTYRYFEDYVVSINNKLNAIILKYDEQLENQEKKILSILNDNIVIILHRIPNYLIEINNINFKNLFFLNTEQTSSPEHLDYIKNFIHKKFHIIDYSKENIDILNKNNIHNIIYFPYIYNQNEFLNINKTNNICTMKPCESYRNRIVANIQKHNIDINFINGWNKRRDKVLFSHKILLNLSLFDNYKIFETIRCNRCLFNKMIIISDKKYNSDLIDYSKHIIFVDSVDLPNKIKDVIDNYEKYYKLLDLDNIDMHINDDLINVDILLKYSQ